MNSIFSKFCTCFSDEEFDNLLGEVKNLIEDDDFKSYVHTFTKKWKDGKVVKEEDKKYVNGECISNNSCIEEGKKAHTCDCKTCDCGNKGVSNENNNDKKETSQALEIDKLRYALDENERLEKKNAEYKIQIREMTEYIDGLNDQIKALTMKNNKLTKRLYAIKNVFNLNYDEDEC